MSETSKGYTNCGSLVDVIGKCNEVAGGFRAVVSVLDNNAKIIASAVMLFDSGLCKSIVDGERVSRKTIDDHVIVFDKTNFSFDPQVKDAIELHKLDYKHLVVSVKEEIKVDDSAYEKISKELNKKITFIDNVRIIGVNCLRNAAYGALVLKAMVLFGFVSVNADAFLAVAIISAALYLIKLGLVWLWDAIVNTVKAFMKKTKNEESKGSCVVVSV